LKEKRYIAILSIVIIMLFVSCGKKGDPLPRFVPLPGGINDLRGEVRDGLLFLSFSMPSRNKDGSEMKDLAGFKILKSCGNCIGASFEPFKDLSLDAQDGYTIYGGRIYTYDNDLTSGYQYAYRVYPYTKRGTRGDASNIFSIKWEQPPGVPPDISVREDDGIVELTWRKEEGASYNVYRHLDSTYPLFPLNKTPLTTPYFVDSGLQNNKTYSYEVRKLLTKDGLQSEGEGLKIQATPKDTKPPETPYEIKIEKTAEGVQLTWKAVMDKDLEGYNIYRISSGDAEKINPVPVKENMFTDNSMPDIRYVSYYITAIDTAGNESTPSREVIIILKE
jgi:hypothetical protein